MKTRNYKKKADPSICEKYTLPPYTKITQSPGGDTLKPKKGQMYIADGELSEERYKFDTSKDPCSALIIFIKCVEFGCYPPAEILTFFSNKFKEILKNDKTIDTIPGLSKAAKKHRSNIRDIEIILEIDKLRHYFNITSDYAIHAIKRLYEQKTGKEMSDDFFNSIYYRTGQEKLTSTLMIEHDDIPWLEEFSEEYRTEWKEDLLKKYPADVREYIQKSQNNS